MIENGKNEEEKEVVLIKTGGFGGRRLLYEPWGPVTRCELCHDGFPPESVLDREVFFGKLELNERRKPFEG